MTSSNDSQTPKADIPIISEPSNVPFPSEELDASIPSIETQPSNSSKLTSSDKLSELPSTSPTPLSRVRTPTRPARRSLDASHSLPALLSPTPPSGTTDLPPIGVSVSEGSVGKETTRARVSFDSDRISLPSFQNVRQVISSQMHRNSEPSSAPSRMNDTSPQKDIGVESPSSRSHSRTNSRANSPLRGLFPWGLHRGHSREEPFIPVDPFKLKLRLRNLSESRRFGSLPSRRGDDEHDEYEWCDYDCTDAIPTHCCLPPPVSCASPSSAGFHNFLQLAQHFIVDIFPRQAYLHFLLRLPSLYFSRVARIFEDAEVSRPDIQRMIDACSPRSNGRPNVDRAMSSWAAPDGGPTTAMGVGIAAGTGAILGATGQLLPYPEDWTPPTVSPALARFKNSWEAFIDSLMREWKTQNVVSALLLSAILTMFQIPSAATDPVTRTAALLSLICALMSLSYGCMYIVRFGTMRSMYKASRWAEEARKTNTMIWWNVWVLLAMPAVWLAWSMLLFVVAILSFVWRTGSVNDPEERSGLSPAGALGPRIAITSLFGLGMVYFVMIVRTLQSYSGPKLRGSFWGSGSNVGSVPPGGGGSGVGRDRSRDGETRRGRERERRTRGGRNNREREPQRERETHRDEENNRQRDESEGGKERAPSGLRKVWTGRSGSSNEAGDGHRPSDEITGEPEKEEGEPSEKVAVSDGG